MVTQEDILQEMNIIFKEKLMLNLEKQLTFETDLINDLGLDSIMSLELIVEIEVKYGLEIDENELKSSIFSNLGNFVNFIAVKIQQKDLLGYVTK